MNKEEIKEFLKSHRGYLKWSPKNIRDILLKKGFTTTIKLCKEALIEVNKSIYNYNIDKISKNITSKILIYDIETSYLIVGSWRIGWDININHEDIISQKKIICISYKWLGEKEIYNLTWDKNKDDKFLLEQFIEVMNEANLLVAHNGDKYDLKFIKTRAILQGLPMLINYPQFDTLKVAKKKFMFDSNKLDNITKDLGIGEKYKTDKKLWDDIILKQDPIALQKMIDYCNQDVLLLEKLYNILVFWENPKYHQGVLEGKTKQTSPISGSKNLEKVKKVTTNQGTIKYIMKDLDTNRLFEMSETNYNKYLEINNAFIK